MYNTYHGKKYQGFVALADHDEAKKRFKILSVYPASDDDVLYMSIGFIKGTTQYFTTSELRDLASWLCKQADEFEEKNRKIKVARAKRHLYMQLANMNEPRFITDKFYRIANTDSKGNITHIYNENGDRHGVSPASGEECGWIDYFEIVELTQSEYDQMCDEGLICF